MRVYQITHECLIRDYHGAGRAWAAVADGVVVATSFTPGDSPGCWADKPAWVAAVEQHATDIDAGLLPTCRGSEAAAAMAELAAALRRLPQTVSPSPLPADGAAQHGSGSTHRSTGRPSPNTASGAVQKLASDWRGC